MINISGKFISTAISKLSRGFTVKWMIKVAVSTVHIGVIYMIKVEGGFWY